MAEARFRPQRYGDLVIDPSSTHLSSSTPQTPTSPSSSATLPQEYLELLADHILNSLTMMLIEHPRSKYLPRKNKPSVSECDDPPSEEATEDDCDLSDAVLEKVYTLLEQSLYRERPLAKQLSGFLVRIRLVRERRLQALQRQQQQQKRGPRQRAAVVTEEPSPQEQERYADNRGSKRRGEKLSATSHLLGAWVPLPESEYYEAMKESLLSNTPESININMDPRKLKVNELKEQLQLAGLSVNGKKEELVARLLEHQKAEEAALGVEGPATGTGETFDWEDGKFDVDDLAPPTDPTSKAPENKGLSNTTASASTAEPGSTNPSTTAASAASEKKTAAATAAAATTTGAAAASGTLKDVQFQGAVKDAETLKAEFEKRKNRAARFGIPLKEQDKAVERAARFGVPVMPAATASLAKATLPAKPAATTPASVKPVPAKPGSVVAQIPADVLNKRRERFGIQAPSTTSSTTPVVDAAEEEKKRKRAAKFGTAPSSEEITKKMKA
ncbi:hypothetical protein EC968_001327 [Mortierella alpina]|nr:hypothetical protein EC968_001327 [Mortierella alpina]